jgi:hypothetical protein
LAKAVFMLIANAVLQMIATETMIFPIVDMDLSFLTNWPRQSQPLPQRTRLFSSRIPILDWRARPEFRAIAAACTIPTG